VLVLLQTDQVNTPESTYQASFDTVDGEWSEVMLPWHNFVPVKRAQSDPDGGFATACHDADSLSLLKAQQFDQQLGPRYLMFTLIGRSTLPQFHFLACRLS
jgi:hypothetical protein